MLRITGSRGQITVRAAALALKLLAGALVLWVIASALAENVMLHPRRWGVGPPPSARGVAYTDVAFKDSAGLTLRGWWMPGTRHQTLVMIHGWTSSRREPMDKAGYLLAAGYNVLVFDLRGHGLSDGHYTTLGYVEPADVRAAVSFAHAMDPAAPIALFGYSMGAAIALEEAPTDPLVQAVVEDSGFSSLASVFSADFRHLLLLPADPFGLAYLAIAQRDLGFNIDAVRPGRSAARLDKPLLAIIGTSDTVVPPSEGYAIFSVAPGPKQLLVVPGAAHTAAYYRANALYERTVLDFLSQSLR